MATIVTNKKGERVVLLNPAERAELYARSLRDNYNPRTGDALTAKGRAYRSGYLAARRDNARAWKHNQKKRAAKRASKKK